MYQRQYQAMASKYEFSGKVFLVTGASSGLGESLVLLLASRGASVALCGRDPARLEDVRKRCVHESGGYEQRFLVVQGDLKESEARKRYVQSTVQRFGQLDVLVANAGVMTTQCGIQDTTEASYDHTMDVNVKSVFFLIQEAVPHLEKTKGAIVTVSSFLSEVPVSGNIVYPVSKAAVDHMTRCLALDLGPKGVRVNNVNPGLMITQLYREAGTNASLAEASKGLVVMEEKNYPLEGRISSTKEVAEVIVYLSSPGASFITGQCLQVDGGRAINGAIRF